ncbi:MAG: glycoside hydrolase family 3 C-terminal domain-containing protein, partial [Ignavibacteriales bacterium]|nr:glycoside hydrolase family 3 C-terminal domain-containing protein [Ignavibacteriales bacterium]
HDQAATLKEAKLSLKAGTLADVKLEYYEHTGNAQLSFGWSKAVPSKDAEAVKLAARSDVAVVCVGFNATTEGEGFDRNFALSKEQQELIKEVAKVNRQANCRRHLRNDGRTTRPSTRTTQSTRRSVSKREYSSDIGISMRRILSRSSRLASG